MGKKDILKVISKSDENRRRYSVYRPKFRKIRPFTPPRTPQNHPTVTIFNRVSLRWLKKIFWKFYRNRMKIEGAVLFTSRNSVKFHLLHLPEHPQNHPTVTNFDRVSLRWVKKIFWKFYQNRMKNEGAVLFTSRNSVKFHPVSYTHLTLPTTDWV